MYQDISRVSRFLSEPFMTMYNSVELPLFIAFLLGIIGSLAPCQLTGNISALTIYGNRSLQTTRPWSEVIFFVMGKVAAFSILGFLVWLAGHRFEESMTVLFPIMRKAIGPFLILQVSFYLEGLS